METPKYKTALIVGAGEGLSASLARLFAREKIKVALAARKLEKLGALCRETGAQAYACNAANAGEVERLFGDWRPLHRPAVGLAKERAIAVHCCDEGYLRPNWITVELLGI